MHVIDQSERQLVVLGPAPARRGPTLASLRAWPRVRITDEWAVALLAAALSIGFFIFYERRGLTAAFNDARSRELIARRVLMSRTPGLAQFGTTWPPLLYLFMLPTIWNNTLFDSGLAGALPSMLAYVITALYIYRTARLVTSSRAAGWVAASALALNPSLLYMQTTAMSETGSLAASVVAIFYGLRAAQTLHAADVVRCAAAVACGTLIRYDNWLLGFVLLPLLVYVAWRRRDRALAEAWGLLYTLLAFAGCAAWVVYNWVIFHDPILAFFYGQSSHTYFAGATAAELPARNHPLFAFETYGLAVAKTVGWVLVPAALLGLLVFVWRARLRPTLVAAYLTLIPFAFYWVVLYKGVNQLNMPELGSGGYYNIRFGLAMVPAVALFVGVLTTVGPKLLRGGLVAAALGVAGLSAVSGVTQTTPFVLREALASTHDVHRTEVDAAWLSAHYEGGAILFTYIGDPSPMFYLITKHNFRDTAFVTDANGQQFARAVAHPERWVNWIILNSDKGNAGDHLKSALLQRSDWRHYFILRRGGEGQFEFFERIGAINASSLGLQEQSVITDYRLRAELRSKLGSHGGSNGPAVPAGYAKAWSGWIRQGREVNGALKQLREEALLCGRAGDPLGALGFSSFSWPVALHC
jgi:Dolichyl-phosphate-mannose-protein mannosyltransferase